MPVRSPIPASKYKPPESLQACPPKDKKIVCFQIVASSLTCIRDTDPAVSSVTRADRLAKGVH